MRFLKLVYVALSLIVLASCGAEKQGSSAKETANKRITEVPASAPAARAQISSASDKQTEPHQGMVVQPVSLKQADQSQAVADAILRKIIKDAELTLEVNSPIESQRKVTSIAEGHGGFVVTSESKQRQSTDSSERVLDITLVLRVPATEFGAVLEEIRAVGTHITQEKTTGQDVTEEFIDLEARLKTQKALEAQFLEIMKQAHKVEDALAVQTQIADVRTEIEKLEGRKRFLDNKASLSTITVNLQSPSTIVVTTSGFGRNLREAAKESVDVAVGIVLFLIRFVIVMIPIFFLIIVPVGLVARYLLRRARRIRAARPATVIPSIDQATETVST